MKAKENLHGKASERLRFRHLQPSDMEILVDFFSQPDNFKYMIDPRPDVEGFVRSWMEKQDRRLETTGLAFCALINKLTGEYLGQGGLIYQDIDGKSELEIGYHLLPEHRGQGYATEMARYFRDFAFERKMEDSLISIIHLDNEPSKKVARRNGMLPEKRTRFLDIPVEVYRIDRSGWLQLM